MVSLRRSLPLVLISLLLSVGIAACGFDTGSSGTGSSSNSMMASSPTSTAAHMTSMTPTSAPMNKPLTPTASANAFIRTMQVTLNGKVFTVLTTTKGMMLYYRLNDPAPESGCTGGCAMAWPPLIANGMLTSSLPLPHKLTVYMTGNGNQVEYDGHPLYTYASDMAPGQYSGRGMGNVWYLVSIYL